VLDVNRNSIAARARALSNCGGCERGGVANNGSRHPARGFMALHWRVGARSGRASSASTASITITPALKEAGCVLRSPRIQLHRLDLPTARRRTFFGWYVRYDRSCRRAGRWPSLKIHTPISDAISRFSQTCSKACVTAKQNLVFASSSSVYAANMRLPFSVQTMWTIRSASMRTKKTTS